MGSWNAKRCLSALLPLALCLTSALAQKPPEQAKGVLDDARAEVNKLNTDMAAVSKEAKAACANADAASKRLLDPKIGASAALEAMAITAAAQRVHCEQLTALETKTNQSLDAARKQLLNAAAGRTVLIDEKKVAPSPPPPAAPSPLASAPRTDAQPESTAYQCKKPDLAPGTTSTRGSAGTPSPEDLADVLDSALTAQERVQKERDAGRGLYDLVDRATKIALTLKQASDIKHVEDSGVLQTRTKQAQEAGRTAQRAANGFVDAALRIKLCQLKPDAKCQAQYQRDLDTAETCRADMGQALRAAKDAREKVETAAAEIITAGQWKTDTERLQALKFAKLIETYPSAAAPFTKSGLTFLASGKDKSATIKLGADQLLPNGWDNWALEFSTPLADSGPSRVFSFSDGLIGLPKLGLSRSNLQVRKILDSSSWLSSWALGLKVGYSNRSYYDDGPSLPKSASKKRVTPWEASVAYVAHEVTSNNSHLGKLAWQRRIDDASPQTRCPVDTSGTVQFVSCLTGSFGPPEAQEGGIVTYQYRYMSGDFAASPTLSYNTRTRVSGFGLPLFLLRENNDKKNPFNAGIRADWVSKGKFEITGGTKNTWTFGVFVSSSFDLLGRQE